MVQIVVQNTAQGYYCINRVLLTKKDEPISNHILALYSLLMKSAKAKPTVIIRPMYLASAGR